MQDTPRIVQCPTCGKTVKWTPNNPFRPFCCERCKLIDLGEWAQERHRIAGDPEHEDIYSDDLDD